MTYDSLVLQVKTTLQRTDDYFIQNIPQFITQAHDRLVGEAIALEFVVYANGMLTANFNRLEKPAFWRRPLSLKLMLTNSITGADFYQDVTFKSYEFCRKYWPSDTMSSTEVLDPLYYGDYGQQWLIVSPVPSRALPFELSFYGVPPVISPLIQTNYLTQYAPNALLYATLIEAANFVQNDARVPVWQQYYQSALTAFNEINKQGKEDRFASITKD